MLMGDIKLRECLIPISEQHGTVDFPVTALILLDDIDQVIVKRIKPNELTGFKPIAIRLRIIKTLDNAFYLI